MILIPRYEQAKLALGDWLGESDKVLHIHMGLLIYVGVRMLSRFRTSPLLAWAAVAAFEAANEIVDRIAYHSWRRIDTTHDVIDTLLWPTLLTLARLVSKGSRPSGRSRRR